MSLYGTILYIIYVQREKVRFVMKHIWLVILFCVMIVGTSNAQYKNENANQPSIKDGYLSETADFAFGLFNPDNFSMSHSYSMSYSTFGGNGTALGVYTNSIYYKFTDNLNIEIDASLVHSPYSSFGDKFQSDISGIYLSRARLNYKPTDDISIVFQYQQVPGGSYYYNPYYRGYGYYQNSMFFRDLQKTK